jgi:hypothetical protein
MKRACTSCMRQRAAWLKRFTAEKRNAILT